MAEHQPGNGSSKFVIGVHDMGGWVRVVVDNATAAGNDLGAYLSHRLSEWLRQNTHLRLLAVVPIARDGNTVELHAWYEQHSFPDKSSLAGGR
jgi:hypothetical protein